MHAYRHMHIYAYIHVHLCHEMDTFIYIIYAIGHECVHIHICT